MGIFRRRPKPTMAAPAAVTEAPPPKPKFEQVTAMQSGPQGNVIRV